MAKAAAEATGANVLTNPQKAQITQLPEDLSTEVLHDGQLDPADAPRIKLWVTDEELLSGCEGPVLNIAGLSQQQAHTEIVAAIEAMRE